jgi:hypothetical protein
VDGFTVAIAMVGLLDPGSPGMRALPVRIDA